MTFLVIFTVLVAERFLLRFQSLRRGGWYQHWMDLHQSLPVSKVLREGRIGLLLLLAPPLLGVALVQNLLDDMLLGLPGVLFAALVLLYSLGPEDLDSRVATWVEAGGMDEQEQSRALAAELLERPNDSEGSELGRELTDGILSAALWGSAAVLFWFLVLGPVGALGYRLTRHAKTLAREHGRPGLGEPVRALLFLLEWLPARMLAGLFALGGCFDSAIQGWRHCDQGPDLDPNAALVCCAGVAALPGGETAGAATTERVEAAMALVWRALVIFVALLGLAAVSGWVGS